jgi:hypothetical protein
MMHTHTAQIDISAPALPADDPAALPLACLAARCAEENERFANDQANDGRHGYELFRRALVGHDPAAWQAIEQVYRPALVRWASTDRLFSRTGEPPESFANQALAQLWRQVSASRFDDFPNLASLLGYLRRSVHHLIIDQLRQRVREQQRADVAGQALLVGQEPASPERRALERMQAGEVWTLVRAHCRNRREEELAYGYLVLEMRPQELLGCCPDEGNVRAIYTRLETLVRRLRRSPALRRRYQEMLAG